MAKAQLIVRIWTQGRRKLPDDLPEAFEPHLEHITGLCGEGYLSGEVADDRFSGWWEIKEG